MFVQPRPLPTVLRPVLNAREAAELLGVSPRTVYRWAADGRIASIRIAGSVRVLTAPLLRLLAGRRS